MRSKGDGLTGEKKKDKLEYRDMGPVLGGVNSHGLTVLKNLEGKRS